MKNIIYFFTFICLLGTFSCNLMDNSENSTSINKLEANELLQATISQMAFNQTAITGRTAAVFLNYLGQGDGAFNAYNVTPSSFDIFWKNAYFTGSLASAQKLKELASTENNSNLEGIAMILLAYEFSNVTNTFGDIPFEAALKGVDDVAPRYDTQEDIYEGIIDLLENAIELIENPGAANNLNGIDLIYNGDMSLWTKFAYGLLARTLLNQRNKIIGTDQEILNLLDKSFKDESEQANFQFTDNKPNPLYTFDIERPATFFLSGSFGSTLETNNDPRFIKYTTGEMISSSDDGFVWAGSETLPWTVENTKLPLLSATEILFMKAEVKNHLDFSNDEVANALNDAITMSFLENDLSVNDYGVEEYINNFTNLDGLSKTEMHERIMEQAYTAYYGYNFIQSWNNQRRTRIPNIVNTEIQANDYNPSGSIPVRFLYPTSELELNTIEVEEAIARQNGALLDESIWVFEQ